MAVKKQDNHFAEGRPTKCERLPRIHVRAIGQRESASEYMYDKTIGWQKMTKMIIVLKMT